MNSQRVLDWLGAQLSQICGGVVMLGEHWAFEVTPTMASRVHPEGSRRNEGLQQSVQGQRAGYPQQLIVSILALFFGAGIWACEQMKVDGMVETYPRKSTRTSLTMSCIIVVAIVMSNNKIVLLLLLNPVHRCFNLN